MTLTAQLLEFLRAYDAVARAELVITARSYTGIDRESRFAMRVPDADALPRWILERLVSESLRFAPLTTLGELPLMFAVWHLEHALNRSTKRHEVSPTAAAQVRTALESLPAASVIVEAGPEVWAGWRLETPIESESAALTALQALATRVGAHVPERLTTLTLPLAGVVRNWNGNQPDRILIETFDGARPVALQQLVTSTQETTA